MKILGYNQKWIDFGILTEKYIVNQAIQFEFSEDKNQEHYRALGFYHFIESKSGLSDDDIKNILNLKDNGPDNYYLYEERFFTLIQSELLTDRQLADMSIYPETQQAPIQKTYIRSTLLRQIKKRGLNSKIITKIKKTSDSFIHSAILERNDLESEHILWLSEFGLNKKIRNRATQMLNSKRFRQYITGHNI